MLFLEVKCIIVKFKIYLYSQRFTVHAIMITFFEQLMQLILHKISIWDIIFYIAPSMFQ